jgi:acetyl esterase/lipase
MAGMLPQEAGLDRRCPRRPKEDSLGVSAVFYGITEVPDLLEGKNRRTYAVSWLGGQPNRMEVARRVSLLRYVRSELPPILTIHGDSDAVVPYQHAVRLHEALYEAEVPSKLLTIPGGGHRGFSGEQMRRVYRTIWAFLRAQGVLE